MLFLLNTCRLAYKLGKWRGTLYVIATAVPLALVNFAAKVFSILLGQPQPPVAFQWFEIGLYALLLFLWGYGCYRLYRDHIHHYYYLEADKYQREGW